MSALSRELLCELAKHLPEHAAMACVGKDWNHAVKVTKKKLQDRFLNATFNIECLGLQPFYDKQIEKRVSEATLGLGDIREIGRWWYRTQVCFDIWFGRSVPKPQSFQDLLGWCHAYNPELSRYKFSTFRYLFVPTRRPFGTRAFKKNRYVCDRGVGCTNLGTSVGEVLWTLILARGNDTYCPYRCGCHEQDENSTPHCLAMGLSVVADLCS